MTQYTPIDCALHDELEAACVRGCTVRLALRDGTAVLGLPKDTQTRPDKTEWLVVDIDGATTSVRLDRIAGVSDPHAG